MNVLFFETSDILRQWFEQNAQSETELWVGYYKVGTGKPSITWSESVDEAICVGWIDGIRKSIDNDSYKIRFTPRKSSSIWSSVNIQKVAFLTESGRMKPAGIAAFEKRKESHSSIYSFEQKQIELPENMVALFQKNEVAWKYFQSCTPYYQKTAIWWVISAKQDTTRWNRLQTLITDSEAGEPIKSLRRAVKENAQKK